MMFVDMVAEMLNKYFTIIVGNLPSGWRSSWRNVSLPHISPSNYTNNSSENGTEGGKTKANIWEKET